MRGEEFFDELEGAIGQLEAAGVPHRVLFLEADDETLQRRFNETRRRHPLCTEGGTVNEGITAERERLSGVSGRADMIIDTSPLKPRELRLAIKERFLADTSREGLAVTVSSFGFKYGPPTDADIVMDVRFLPNPFYNPELREHTGLDDPVRDFVLGRSETAEFVEKWHALLDTLVPGYLAEGKTHLAIALGCTGGMHRSVALAEETAELPARARLSRGGRSSRHRAGPGALMAEDSTCSAVAIGGGTGLPVVLRCFASRGWTRPRS